MTASASAYPFDLVLPARYEREPGPFPLLLFLHGRGERGTDLERVRRHGPPRRARQASRPPLLDAFVIVSPQCPADQEWSPAALVTLLAAVETDLRIDPDRRYLTGISMGGHGAWELALAQPERWAALCPIGGWSDPARAARLHHLPVWIVHSAGDEAVPVAASDALFAALQGGHADVTYTRYHGLDHVATWQAAYGRSMLYEWFLAHSRRRP